MRVSTPPLNEDTADGRPRGFFTCMTPPADGPGPGNGNGNGNGNGRRARNSDSRGTRHSDSLTSTPPTPPSTRPASRHGYRHRRTSLSAQTREWWEPMHLRTNRREPPAAAGPPGGFQFDVPEHLPSSPLCPANFRHASGGTGMCVYHGRRRTKATLRDGRSRGESSGSGSGMGRGEDKAKHKRIISRG